MKQYDKITPDGTKELLFEECMERRRVENILKDLFFRHGYTEVVTPGLEYYDVFSKGSRHFVQESMYKLCDLKGRLMVMRPDSTLPIARMTATRLRNESLPIRLFYNQVVYRMNKHMAGSSDEVAQTGVELIGVCSQMADLEVISTASYALSRFKSNDYRIEIGHIGLFQSLVSHITDDTDVKEELRRLIEQKNYARLNDVLEEYSSIPQAKILQRLPRLYGGEEVLKEAESLFVDEETRGILAYLRTLYEQTCQCAQGGKVMLDLGLVNENDYYTGVIFRGYLEGSGETVLSGGRYDHLLRDFGADLPAVGFGVDVDAVTKALMQVNTPQVPPPQVLVFARKGFEIAALHFLRTQVKAGVRCENALCQTLEEALMYAKEKHIQQVAHVGQTIEMIQAGE